MDRNTETQIRSLARNFAVMATPEGTPLGDVDAIEEIKFSELARSLGYEYDSTGEIAEGWYHPAML
jgi:hypothetical protein